MGGQGRFVQDVLFENGELNAVRSEVAEVVVAVRSSSKVKGPTLLWLLTKKTRQTLLVLGQQLGSAEMTMLLLK